MTYRTYAPRTATPAAPRVNMYGGKCRNCGNWIGEREGLAIKVEGKWRVEHNALTGCPEAAAPVVRVAAAVPDLGYYVRKDGAAIKVVEAKTVQPDGSRRRYGLVFTPHPGKRPTWDFVRGAGISVADLTAMSAADAASLGLSHGHCIFCCAPLGGATLSAAVSAIIGYGETCAKNQSLPYPKGVRDQRAFIAVNGS